jgi:hypothetical protein
MTMIAAIIEVMFRDEEMARSRGTHQIQRQPQFPMQFQGVLSVGCLERKTWSAPDEVAEAKKGSLKTRMKKGN